MLLNKKRALDFMERSNLDALIATTPVNVDYLSDYHPFGIVTYESFAILPRAESIPPTLVVGHSALGYLSAFPTWIKNIVTYEEYHFNKVFGDVDRFGVKHTPSAPTTYQPVEALARTLRQLGLDKARLGFDDIHLSEALEAKYIPNLQAVGVHQLMKDIRMVKTPEEIQIMRESAQLSQEAFMEMLGVAKEGATATEVEVAYREAATRRGVHTVMGLNGYSLMSWFSPTLEKGAMVPLAAIADYRWYQTDCGRTMVVGEPTKKQVETSNIIKAASAMLDEFVRPGVDTNEMFSTIRETVAREGGDNDKLALYVHGIGLDSYEHNHHEKEEGWVLEPGNVFCTFLMLMAPEANGAVFVEEETLVTEDGCEQLYTMPRYLFVV